MLVAAHTTPAPSTRSVPLVPEVAALFLDRHRFSKDIVERSTTTFGPSWTADFEDTLQHLYADPTARELAVKGYASFALDSMRRQARFERERTYPAKTYAEAAAEVYFDEDHMHAQYLPGLLLSHFLWPHHYRQLQFFEMAFVATMARRPHALFAEIGIGTGLYSRRVLQRVIAARGMGFDISPSSKAFAENHLRAYGFGHRYGVELCDVITTPIGRFDSLICVEVLEPLEDPLTFLRALRESLAPGGKAFITAAVNAANADHIYLYRSADEVLRHLDSAGFVLEQGFIGAAYKLAQPGLPVPVAAAFVVG